jgi:predicted nucleic acid-binding protein
VILVDTSVWVAHIGRAIEPLAALLNAREVVAHPFVIGEIAMGNLRHRERVLRDFLDLPPAGIVSSEEVLRFVEQHRLFGIGIGYVDAHLLASALLMGLTSLWTFDRRLRAAAQRFNLEYDPTS